MPKIHGNAETALALNQTMDTKPLKKKKKNHGQKVKFPSISCSEI